MYIRIILDTTYFKVVMAMNLSKFGSQVYLCKSSTRMGDLLESLVRGSQTRTILFHWKLVVTNGIKAFAQLEMGGACINP
jgi:hypothetical protein